MKCSFSHAITVTTVPLAAALLSVAIALPAPCEDGKGWDHTWSHDCSEPFHVKLSREDVLAAWQRLRELRLPGVPLDARYENTGDAAGRAHPSTRPSALLRMICPH